MHHSVVVAIYERTLWDRNNLSRLQSSAPSEATVSRLRMAVAGSSYKQGLLLACCTSL